MQHGILTLRFQVFISMSKVIHCPCAGSFVILSFVIWRMGNKFTCMGRNPQPNWSACLVISYTSVFYGWMSLSDWGRMYHVKCVYWLVSHWQLCKGKKIVWLLHKNIFDIYDSFIIININTCKILSANLLCLQLYQSVSCQWRLGNWSIVTGTLRTNLTSSACFIFEFCVCTFVCVSDKEKPEYRSLCHFLQVQSMGADSSIALYISLLLWAHPKSDMTYIFHIWCALIYPGL